jgi:hypothetical protein
MRVLKYAIIKLREDAKGIPLFIRFCSHLVFLILEFIRPHSILLVPNSFKLSEREKLLTSYKT